MGDEWTMIWIYISGSYNDYKLARINIISCKKEPHINIDLDVELSLLPVIPVAEAGPSHKKLNCSNWSV